jgi:hypothetical protein
LIGRRTKDKGDGLRLLELKVRNNGGPEMTRFAEIKALKFDSWDLYFFWTGIRNITKVQGERLGFENGLLLCSVGDAVVLDNLDARLGKSSWTRCKTLTLVWWASRA